MGRRHPDGFVQLRWILAIGTEENGDRNSYGPLDHLDQKHNAE